MDSFCCGVLRKFEPVRFRPHTLAMHGSGVGIGAEGWFARLAYDNTSLMRGSAHLLR